MLIIVIFIDLFVIINLWNIFWVIVVEFCLSDYDMLILVWKINNFKE